MAISRIGWPRERPGSNELTPLRIATVIPAYNAAGTIAKAIASAQDQQRPPDEIIVVDDGSTDDTAAVAAATGVRVIRQANGGPASARNAGIDSTSAEWIAFLDADDSWRPEKLARQVPHLSDARLGVVYAGYHVHGKAAPMPPATVDFDVLWEENRIPILTVLLRRSAWEAIGGFDTDRGIIGVEDYNLWLRLAHAGWGFAGIQERLADYEPTGASLSRQIRPIAKAELAQVARVAAALGLDPERLRSKEYSIYLEYGLEFFFRRDRSAARMYLREAARRGRLTPRTRLFWMATFLPFPRFRAR